MEVMMVISYLKNIFFCALTLWFSTCTASQPYVLPKTGSGRTPYSAHTERPVQAMPETGFMDDATAEMFADQLMQQGFGGFGDGFLQEAEPVARPGDCYRSLFQPAPATCEPRLISKAAKTLTYLMPETYVAHTAYALTDAVLGKPFGTEKRYAPTSYACAAQTAYNIHRKADGFLNGSFFQNLKSLTSGARSILRFFHSPGGEHFSMYWWSNNILQTVAAPTIQTFFRLFPHLETPYKGITLAYEILRFTDSCCEYQEFRNRIKSGNPIAFMVSGSMYCQLIERGCKLYNATADFIVKLGLNVGGVQPYFEQFHRYFGPLSIQAVKPIQHFLGFNITWFHITPADITGWGLHVAPHLRDMFSMWRMSHGMGSPMPQQFTPDMTPTHRAPASLASDQHKRARTQFKSFIEQQVGGPLSDAVLDQFLDSRDGRQAFQQFMSMA